MRKGFLRTVLLASLPVVAIANLACIDGKHFAAQAQSATNRAPMTLSGLVDALKKGIGVLSPSEFVQTIQRRGVSFEVTDSVVRQLQQAGATPEIIQSARDNFRGTHVVVPPPPVYKPVSPQRQTDGTDTSDSFDQNADIASGFGRFHFGMSMMDVNNLLPTPFGNLQSLPVASEFHTEQVHYFWVYTASLPAPSSSASDFKSLHEFQDCWGLRDSWAVFLFAKNRLVRMGVHFFADCSLAHSRNFAAARSIPAVPTTLPGEFRLVLGGDTVHLRIAPDSTIVLDLFENGSPLPEP